LSASINVGSPSCRGSPLVKLIAAFEAAGVEMIDEGAVSNSQGRGVRLKIKSGSAKTPVDARSGNKASGGTRAGT
jgi:hypothetical protein